VCFASASMYVCVCVCVRVRARARASSSSAADFQLTDSLFLDSSLQIFCRPSVHIASSSATASPRFTPYYVSTLLSVDHPIFSQLISVESRPVAVNLKNAGRQFHHLTRVFQLDSLQLRLQRQVDEGLDERRR
jgi:hypothetical protein